MLLILLMGKLAGNPFFLGFVVSRHARRSLTLCLMRLAMKRGNALPSAASCASNASRAQLDGCISLVVRACVSMALAISGVT
jgi:hypothetical protein